MKLRHNAQENVGTAEAYHLGDLGGKDLLRTDRAFDLTTTPTRLTSSVLFPLVDGKAAGWRAGRVPT